MTYLMSDGIELQLLQAALDVLLRFVGVIERIEDDDALGGLHRPGAGPVIAEEVQVVHHLHRLERRLGLHLVVVLHEARRFLGRRGLAQAERAEQVGLCGLGRGGHVPVDDGVVLR